MWNRNYQHLCLVRAKRPLSVAGFLFLILLNVLGGLCLLRISEGMSEGRYDFLLILCHKIPLIVL